MASTQEQSAGYKLEPSHDKFAWALYPNSSMPCCDLERPHTCSGSSPVARVARLSIHVSIVDHVLCRRPKRCVVEPTPFGLASEACRWSVPEGFTIS
jgi:hypothetical protein